MKLLDRHQSIVRIGQILHDLRTAAGADAAVFLSFGMHDGRIVVCDVLRSGTVKRWGLMRSGEPPYGFDHDDSDEAIGMRRGQWCLRAPLKRHFNSFCWLEEDIGQVAPWERTVAFDSLYASNDFKHQYRAIFVTRGAVTGWCGLFWKDRRNAKLAESAAETFGGPLREEASRLSELETRSHRILLADGDELLGVDPEALELFSRDELRTLARRARRRATGAGSRWCHEAWGVDYVPMTGEEGSAHLVLLEPLAPVEIDMRCALTSQQDGIARLVAEGATNGEAADKLGVSRNTVKYHLKNIYEIVGVSNRVELASFLMG